MCHVLLVNNILLETAHLARDFLEVEEVSEEETILDDEISAKNILEKRETEYFDCENLLYALHCTLHINKYLTFMYL